MSDATGSRFRKILSVVLLLLNGINALWGGWELMANPDGSSLGLSPGLLLHSPFSNYFFPGAVLFVLNGIASLIVIFSILKHHRSYPLLIAGQGCLLSGWIIVQVLMIRTVYFLHYFMLGIGILLILTGWIEQKRSAEPSGAKRNRND